MFSSAFSVFFPSVRVKAASSLVASSEVAASSSSLIEGAALPKKTACLRAGSAAESSFLRILPSLCGPSRTFQTPFQGAASLKQSSSSNCGRRSLFRQSSTRFRLSWEMAAFAFPRNRRAWVAASAAAFGVIRPFCPCSRRLVRGPTASSSNVWRRASNLSPSLQAFEA